MGMGDGTVVLLYLGLGFGAFGATAGICMVRQARTDMGWKIPPVLAIGGQLVAVGVGVLLAVAGWTLMRQASIADQSVIDLFAVALLFLFAWRLAMSALVTLLARQSRGVVLLHYRLQRMKWSVFFTSLTLVVAAGLLAWGGLIAIGLHGG